MKMLVVLCIELYIHFSDCFVPLSCGFDLYKIAREKTSRAFSSQAFQVLSMVTVFHRKNYQEPIGEFQIQFFSLLYEEVRGKEERH